jgi:flagellin
MRIGSNLHSSDFAALSSLNKVSQQLSTIMKQISTARRINSGADDPAGLAAVESINSQLLATEQASNNVAYAQSAMAVADAGMGQSLNLLNTIRSDLVAANNGTLSDSQRTALQQETDAALQELDRIGSTTNFAGQKLLDGSTLQFQLSPDLSNTASIQMPNINTGALGGSAGRLSDLGSGGSANLQNGDLQKAQAILDQAQQQIFNARAKTGAFEKDILQISSANLNSMQVNLASSLSTVGDTDMAETMSGLVRSQILAQSLIGVIKANQKNSNLVLNLLKQ